MKYIILAVGLALCALSVVANFWFGTLLAPGNEGVFYGAVFASLDTLKPLLPLAAAAAFAHGLKTKGRVAWCLFALISTLSFTAEIGLYATTKDKVVGGATATQVAYSDAKAGKKEAASALSALGTYRSPGAIAADIGALKHGFLFDRSKQCSDATATDSRALCTQIKGLESALAEAKTKTEDAGRHNRRIEKANRTLSQIDLVAAIRATDPQTEALAHLLLAGGVVVSPEALRTALAVLIALLIEMGSGFGPWLATPLCPIHQSGHQWGGKAEAPSAETVNTPVKARGRPQSGEKMPEGKIAVWALEAIRPKPGAITAISGIHMAYCQWCAENQLRAVDRDIFKTRLETLGRQVGFVVAKRGDRYVVEGAIAKAA